MSSDVMIVCKEFKNSSRSNSEPDDLWQKLEYNDPIRVKWREEHKPVHEAVFIDEASMGEPWTEFGKWFVNRYYNGYSMMEVLMSTVGKGGTQDDVDKMQSEIFDNPFTEVDYEAVSLALNKMQTAPGLDKEKVREYLKLCVGKSISTENW